MAAASSQGAFFAMYATLVNRTTSGADFARTR